MDELVAEVKLLEDGVWCQWYHYNCMWMSSLLVANKYILNCPTLVSVFWDEASAAWGWGRDSPLSSFHGRRGWGGICSPAKYTP
jgi:hypothetical protein